MTSSSPSECHYLKWRVCCSTSAAAFLVICAFAFATHIARATLQTVTVNGYECSTNDNAFSSCLTQHVPLSVFDLPANPLNYSPSVGATSSTSTSSAPSNPGPHCKHPALGVNTQTIKNNENSGSQGIPLNQGTVPPGPYSGLTVSYGVDLRWWTLGQITSWGVSVQGQEDLNPYLALPAVCSQLVLRQGMYRTICSHTFGPSSSTVPSVESVFAQYGSFTLSASDVNALFQGAYQDKLSSLMYYLQNNDGINFEQLPSGTQTALMDYMYNYGSLQGNINADLAAENWYQLAAAFKALGGRYIGDGDMISNDINKKEFPHSGAPC